MRIASRTAGNYDEICKNYYPPIGSVYGSVALGMRQENERGRNGRGLRQRKAIDCTSNPIRRSNAIKRHLMHLCTRIQPGLSRSGSVRGDSRRLSYAATGRESYHNVYIDLSRKTSRQLANIAIVKQKIEEDFVSFKLRMFFQLMLDYSILNEDEYYEILYGTTDRKKIYLVKTGLTINLINRLEKDDQLKNITFDRNGNLATNDLFDDYLKEADDFYRFELSRFL